MSSFGKIPFIRITISVENFLRNRMRRTIRENKNLQEKEVKKWGNQEKKWKESKKEAGLRSGCKSRREWRRGLTRRACTFVRWGERGLRGAPWRWWCGSQWWVGRRGPTRRPRWRRRNWASRVANKSSETTSAIHFLIKSMKMKMKMRSQSYDHHSSCPQNRNHSSIYLTFWN